MKIGFHTDAFNSAYWSFEKCLQWAQENQVHFIECGIIDGVSWIHGLGYQPHVALYEDPLLLRKKMERYGVRFRSARVSWSEWSQQSAVPSFAGTSSGTESPTRSCSSPPAFSLHSPSDGDWS